MATVDYTFSTGVPNITPAVYASDDIGGSDLNTDPVDTNSAGVLTLTLDVGDYVAQWEWEGDTHQTTGEVASPDTLGEVAAAHTAADITYDNTTSELTATDVQAALDEVVARVAALETP